MIMRIVAALGLSLLLSLGAPVMAQQSGGLAGLDCPSEPVRIVVLGDSLADGLWGSFTRAFADCAGVSVERRTTVSDGLVRSGPDTWLARAAEGGPADLIVLQIGANDITNLRDGTTRMVWGTPEWRAAYDARAEALATGLLALADDVIWMGLPIVGRAQFEEGYRVITGLQATAAERAGARFVDTHEPMTFGAGEFVMSAQVEGRTRQIRNNDQVHFTQLGYDLVAGLLRADVENVFQARSREAALGGLVLQ